MRTSCVPVCTGPSTAAPSEDSLSRSSSVTSSIVTELIDRGAAVAAIETTAEELTKLNLSDEILKSSVEKVRMLLRQVLAYFTLVASACSKGQSSRTHEEVHLHDVLRALCRRDLWSAWMCHA